ncbi:Undecaprenyl-diphosphatase [Olavius algarvensis spirochete endosymbiont]|uniref:undecaprenyl-diphosphate phosphatase n=1 Tax=Olavius algarvensis spirochete endosymbiont TaxID=260710 RepID=UPI000F2B0B60|nr:undecaprenyl-diphosphate phosphatase [Olavius algarvensis spirochete endosymbiont]CAD7839409.1 MAG: Undecaprenyl-diphosphatase (EC 3.6.1.27) [Olavius algarvensis spirochete endosymbiont]VDA99706.1 Undecaprenyl-diphosphatase [Olavius algarvensis spirochete endosymbiont]
MNQVTVLQAALLGLIQGLTEFLPISSSGHLVLARALMDLNEVPVLFDVLLHIATLLVVVWVFRRRLGWFLASLFRYFSRQTRESDKPNLRLFLRLLVATAITAIVAYIVSGLRVRESPVIVSAFLMLTALILLSTVSVKGNKNLEELSWVGTLVTGTAQGFGVFPGISRSGITIASGMMVGMDRRAAGEFSFLLLIPAVAAAFLLSLRDAAELSNTVSISALLVGFTSALIAGYASLKFLLWLIARGRLWFFAIYLIPVSIMGLLHFGF